LHIGRLLLSSWAVGEQFLHATFVEAQDICPCTIQSPLKFASFAHKLVPLREKVFVLLAEPVTILFDPGAIRLSQLSQQVTHELALGGKLTAELAYFIFGVERPLPPRRFLLSRSLLDPAVGARLGSRLGRDDHRVR
jgi:hypothetical protein